MDKDSPQLDTLREAETIERNISRAAETIITEDDKLIGAVLDHRYVVKRKIGHGGFGAVYLAADQKMLSRPVVVKMLLGEKITHEWSVRKFRQEMEAMARIDHPSIVGVFDSGQTDDGNPYIVMQYVDGVSLRSLINAPGMDLNRVANFVKQIGKALSVAHDRGILHRDLKPENVMVQTLADGDEQVKIIDFGIAKVKDSVVSLNTETDGTVGTVAYMSPEQLSARNVTPASDVYSLGIIAYEMLTGQRPVNPDSAYQLLELQRSGVRIRPSELRPDTPPAAEAVILKALSFDPAERFERARDFGDLLSAALIGDEEQTQIPNKAETPPDSAAIESVNLHGEGFGNAAVLSKAPVKTGNHAWLYGTAGIILALAIAGGWFIWRKRTPQVTAPVSSAPNPVVGPQQSLTYWITVQKMLNNKPLGSPYDTEGNISFGNGWKFRLNVRPDQSGALYLLNVGPGPKGADEYNILFPSPKTEGDTGERLEGRLVANQTVQLPAAVPPNDWYRFMERTGVEDLWLIWSVEPIRELDTIFNDAARDKDNPGVITRPDQIAQLQTYFKQYDAGRIQVNNDKPGKRSSMKGFGNVVVYKLQLSHEAY